MLKRTLNYRPTWNVVLEEKIAGNYYPVTTRIAIEENTNIWSIVTDRAQGGASLEDGTMELMVSETSMNDCPPKEVKTPYRNFKIPHRLHVRDQFPMLMNPNSAGPPQIDAR